MTRATHKGLQSLNLDGQFSNLSNDLDDLLRDDQ
jgi:hypothetical protein